MAHLKYRVTKRFTGLALLALILCIFSAPLMWYKSNLKPLDSKNSNVLFVVQAGMGTSQIGELLQEKGVIRSSLAFRILSRNRRLDGKLQSGTYRLSPSMTPMRILDILSNGEVAVIKVTIPEGLTSKQIASILKEKRVISSETGFLDLVAKGSIEGLLFPDTYFFPEGMTEGQVVGVMTDRFKKEVAPVLGEKVMKDSRKLRDIVTLASIVEREAKKEEERPLVSSVFANRLKKGMKLESCATIQYILGHTKARLLYEDLKIQSPYNTYINKGLPPGPISNPGLPSIIAAASPAHTDYLFFVAKEDGTHTFTEDFKDHVKAKETNRRVVK